MRHGYFSLVIQYQRWRVRDTVYLPKCVLVLFAPLGVNHGEHSFYRVSRSKIEIHSHGNSVFRYRVLGYTTNTQLSHLWRTFQFCLFFRWWWWWGGCYDFFSFFFFWKGQGACQTLDYKINTCFHKSKWKDKEKNLFIIQHSYTSNVSISGIFLSRYLKIYLI